MKKLRSIKRKWILAACLLLSIGVFISLTAHKSIKTEDSCNPEINDEECWKKEMNARLDSGGVESAFDFIDSMYNKNQDFAASCHGLTHDLGRRAYLTFQKDKDSVFSAKASYCAYGFYHGFMEELLHTSGDINEAREFCALAHEKLSVETNDAGGACYHGIGHGIVEDVPNPEAWGDPIAVIKPGIELCEKVSDTNFRLYRCTSGVFNAIEILMSAGLYDLTLDYSDPFRLCRMQPHEYKAACYTQFVVPVRQIAGDDYRRGIELIEQASEEEFAVETLDSFMLERSRTNPDDYDATLALCRTVGVKFHLPCIASYGKGFIKYGPPKNEHVKALAFCESDLLTEEERKTCFAEVLPLLRMIYTVDKATQICSSVERRYQVNGCNYEA